MSWCLGVKWGKIGTIRGHFSALCGTEGLCKLLKSTGKHFGALSSAGFESLAHRHFNFLKFKAFQCFAALNGTIMGHF